MMLHPYLGNNCQLLRDSIYNESLRLKLNQLANNVQSYGFLNPKTTAALTSPNTLIKSGDDIDEGNSQCEIRNESGS